MPPPTSPLAIGAMIRHWRTHRGLSQMALAFEADLSPRHVSFVETGRARPSRDAVQALAEALDVPLRERNALFEAAGFARPYSEATLSDAELAFHQRLVASVLRRHEPFFAVAIDRHWDIRQQNRAAEQFLAPFFRPGAIEDPGPPNLARLLFHPAGLRSCLVNQATVFGYMGRRLHREAVRNPFDEGMAALIEELESYGDVPRRLASRTSEHALVLHLAIGGREARLVGSVLAFDSGSSPALDELRIETFFPADEATARQLEDAPLASWPDRTTVALHSEKS